MMRRGLLSVLGAAMAVCALAVSAAPASAVEFGVGGGSGAGELTAPAGVADSSYDGNLYLLDAGNSRIDVFAQNGAFLEAWGWGVGDAAPQQPKLEKCTTSCFKALSGAGAGELEAGAAGIAVDNYLLGTSYGAVYVVDKKNNRVEKYGPAGEFKLAFGKEVNTSKVAVRKAEEAAAEPVTVTPAEENVCSGGPGDECGKAKAGKGESAFEFGAAPAIAVGASGIVYVGDKGRIQEFAEDGEYLRAPLLTNKGGKALGAKASSLAVGTTGDVYVTVEKPTVAEEAAGVLQYEESAPGTLKLVRTMDAGGRPDALAVDEDDDLFVDNNVTVAEGGRHIYEYASTGAQIEAFGAGLTSATKSGGIALDSSTKELAVTSFTGSFTTLLTIGVPAPGPLVVKAEARPQPGGCVALHAVVNPEGAETAVTFEYEATGGHFVAQPPQKIPGVVGGAPNFADATADAKAAPLEATFCGLAASTGYSYRVSVSNQNGSSAPRASFTTLPAAEIAAISATDVTATAATLRAEVNPLELPATYWFEYRASGASVWEQSVKQRIAAVDAEVGVSAHVSDLRPNMRYSYRLVVEDALAEGASAIVSGEAELRTQGEGAPLRLLDGRAWEQVSPVHKQGASFGVASTGGIVEASADGAGVTYLASSSTESSPAGEPSPNEVQILAAHGPEGWVSHDIAPPHEEEWGPTAGHGTEFLAFSPDLGNALLEPEGTTLLGGASERTPYIRRQSLCAAAMPSCYLPLVTSANTGAGAKWGGPVTDGRSEVHYLAATPDFKHVMLESEVPLLAGDSGRGFYEWNEGSLELVSVLPGELPRQAGCLAESRPRLRNVISEDGSRVVWGDCEGHLYMHEAAAHASAQLDTVQAGASGANGSKAEYQDASASGDRVFFTDQQQLTTASHAATGRPELYVYEADPNGAGGAVRDLTIPVASGEAGDVMGAIPGASADGSVVYVVAGGVLTEAGNGREAPQAGQPNLYRIERVQKAGSEAAWTPTFVATLSPEDGQDWAGPNDGQIATLSARVSASGQWLSFMSDRPLTGYDNRDAVSGQRDEEVYLYDGATSVLSCASCNPTGARPHGEMWPSGSVPLIDPQQAWLNHWLAGVLPGWDTMATGTASYQPRNLSDAGRLFFDSTDALVPQDVNGTVDAYEFEPAGVGSCTPAAATYSSVSGGCVDLVSSGTSTEESVFLDASESGNDAFFLTAAKIGPQDTDSGFDVYDAHVCGSGWECAPPAAGAVLPCESSAACKAGSVAGGALPGAIPGSATFEGAGNLAAPRKAAGKHKPKKARSNKRRSRRRAAKHARCLARARHVNGKRRRRRAMAHCSARGRAGRRRPRR
jgi:hypothetical protein